MKQTYIINTETVALASHFYNGYEYSRILEGKEIFLVAQSPDQIVKASFIHVGSYLEGAIKSARSILRKKYKLPVALSAPKNIILIRCNATNKEGTVWLVNSRIEDICPHPNGHTIVYTTEGHSLTVDIKTQVLQDKRNQATFLHTTLLERLKMQRSMTFIYEKDHRIMLVKEEGHLNYIVKKNTDEKLEKPVK